MRFTSCGSCQCEVTAHDGTQFLLFHTKVLAVMLGTQGPILVPRDLVDHHSIRNLRRWLADKTHHGVVKVHSTVLKQVARNVEIF